MRALAAIVAAIGMGVVASACSSTDPPAQSQLAVDFPSTQLAAVTETLLVQVFDADAVAAFYKHPVQDACLDLVQSRRTGQQLPAPMVDQRELPVCQYFAGKGGSFSLGYGTRAFVVVGLTTPAGAAPAAGASSELLIGCTRSGVGDAQQQIHVPLTLFDNQVQIPATTCTRLADKCAGGC